MILPDNLINQISDKGTLVLSTNDIEKIVQNIGIDVVMDTLIERLTTAFKNFDPSQTIIPARSGFNYTSPALGLIEWMPLYQHGQEVVIKVVGYHPRNPETHQLPTIISTISNYDTQTGHLKSIMDGVFLTALRTGAASAVVSRYLAMPDSTILGLIGCGAQAITQLHALSRVFDIQKVLYFDKDEETMASFEERVELLQLNITYSPADIETIIGASDIVSTATSIDVGEGPLFSGLKTQDHLHINAVGSDFPGKTELPKELLLKSMVCPDFLDQAICEGECQQLERENIGPDIFECIQNEAQYTAVQKMRTVFDSTGLSLEDQVVMDLFLEYAFSMNLGKTIHIEKIPIDAKSPYEFLVNKNIPTTSKTL